MREHEIREPFAYIIQDKYERERGVEGHLSRSHVSKYVSQEDINEHEITCTPLYRHAQPAPAVPDELLKEYLRLVQCMLSDYRDGNYGNAQRWIRHIAKASDDFERKHGISPWEMARKTCRAAMLHAGNSPAQSPIDHGYQLECECSGCKATSRICAELAGNPPANPGCWCRTCRPVDLNDMRFVVCPDCGNKRCPRANDHRNACTGSNEPGQEGSAYPDTPREVK